MPDMTRSTVSFASVTSHPPRRNSNESVPNGSDHAPTSPLLVHTSTIPSSTEQLKRSPVESRHERTSLLSASRPIRKYTESRCSSPRARSLSGGYDSSYGYGLSRTSSRQTTQFGHNQRPGLRTPKTPRFHAPSVSGVQREIVWYDQFTSTDWVRDSIAEGHRILELRQRKGWRGRVALIYDAAQGWILIAIIGALTAAGAYVVDVVESPLYDLKHGYCSTTWFRSRRECCHRTSDCAQWIRWGELLHSGIGMNRFVDWLTFIIGCLVFAGAACFLTLRTKMVIPSHIATTVDENLGAERFIRNAKRDMQGDLGASSPESSTLPNDMQPPTTYYPAAGSGVAEVKVILSGFVLHRYLGVKSLVYKTIGLILSVASGMSLGKEGPYVHIAACVGNVACRLFPKYNLNDAKRREVLSASAASGVAVAFGSPLGGVLFSLEEVSYYFPPKTLFRTFVCCIVAALSLKFWDPYGTKKIVLFEVRYVSDWQWFELLCFSLVGILGGVLGALFIKVSRLWAVTFRRLPSIRKHPMLEVLLVALVTGLISYWNRYANIAVAELLFELASPCGTHDETGLCPRTIDDIPSIIGYLFVAFVVKAFLTIITFGIKVPAGIYVPSMVVGGLLGRIIGHALQYLSVRLHSSWAFGHCPATGHLENCITPGVYALVAAGATMCGVTRLSVTLAVILFELTGSLDHVLPFSLGILFAKWTADFIEPRSIYDLLIDMNSYPFMDNRATPIFDSELGEITPRPRSNRLIDVTISPVVLASELRGKLVELQAIGEIDGGLPIIRDKILVGLIPVPDLEYALDRLPGPEDSTLCLMADARHAPFNHRGIWMSFADNESIVEAEAEETMSTGDPVTNSETSRKQFADLTMYVDQAPVALDVHSPMSLVHQFFVKLGLRYVCVVEDGEYKGLVHKKVFVKYVKDNEKDLTGH